MNYFNFINLPLLVQDIITKEIVHNSIPGDRVQFALTSKYCHELVKRAKPKKIIISFTMWKSFNYTSFIRFQICSKKIFASAEKIMKILQKCQIETLILEQPSMYMKEIYLEYPKFEEILSEALQSVTTLQFNISDYEFAGSMSEFIHYYKKMKNLKTLVINDKFFDTYKLMRNLLYFPPNIQIFSSVEGLLPHLFFEKTQQRPLSSLFADQFVVAKALEKILKDAKLSDGAEINVKMKDKKNEKYGIYITYIQDENLCEIEAFPLSTPLVQVDQILLVENDRILKLKQVNGNVDAHSSSGYSFIVKSPNNPEQFVQGVELKTNDKKEKEFLFKNIDPTDWIKVISSPENCVNFRYSNKMLNHFLPRGSNLPTWERLKIINKTLDCKITPVKFEQFKEFNFK